MDNIERGAVAHGVKKNPFVKQGLVPRRVADDRVQSIRTARRNRDAAQAKTAAISRNTGRLQIIVDIRENVYRTRCGGEQAMVYWTSSRTEPPFRSIWRRPRYSVFANRNSNPPRGASDVPKWDVSISTQSREK